MKQVIKVTLAIVTLAITALSCKKESNDSASGTAGSKLRILTSSTGQNQTITANIDNTGYTNFNAQTVLADGGSPLHAYTWSLDLSSNPPAGVSIGSQTGVITRAGTSSTGLTSGKTTFKVKVSDGTSTATGTVELIVSTYTPGPAAILQQLSSNFTLVDGVANKSYGASLFAMGGVPPYSWALDASYAGSADLTNAGLVVDGASGIVRGTLLASASGKTIKFKVIVTDNTGTTAVYNPVYTIQVK